MLLSRGLFTFFSAFFLLFNVHSFSEYNGLTFKHLGPNCFGSALKIAGHYQYFRGVDAQEFAHYISNYCEETDIPTKGDIGVFTTPGSDYVVHAFVQINEDTVVEKSGVDYLGVTPIKVQSLETTLFVFKSSYECKRFSGNHPSCQNDLKYYSCAQPGLNLSERFQELTKQFEEKLESVLIQGLEQSDTDLINQLFSSLKSEIYKQTLNEKDKKYLSSKMVSYEKQLQFLKITP